MAVIEEHFVRSGTVTNLLGIVRGTPVRVVAEPDSTTGQHTEPGEPSSSGHDHEGPPCPLELCLTDLIYCDQHRPPFDPTSKRRYDRHPSNPAASMFFSGSSGQ